MITCGSREMPLISDLQTSSLCHLLFSIGVAFNIYFDMAWRSGETNLTESRLARAVLFSARTRATALGGLWLSTHQGTAGMG